MPGIYRYLISKAIMMVMSLQHNYIGAWLSSVTMNSSSSSLFLPQGLAEVWGSACGEWMHSCFCLFLQVFHRWFAPPAGQLCGQTSWPHAPTYDIQTCRSGQNSTYHAAAEYLPTPPPSRAGQCLCHTPSGEIHPESIQNCSSWWSSLTSGGAGLGPFLWLTNMCPPIR